MTKRTGILLALLTTLTIGCDKAPNEFEMSVEQVDELKGFILKGISISGTVQTGCIANDNGFHIKRNGKQMLETITRILSVTKQGKNKPFNGEATKGEYVTLYIPDGKLDDVKLGDRLISNLTTCKKRVPKK